VGVGFLIACFDGALLSRFAERVGVEMVRGDFLFLMLGRAGVFILVSGSGPEKVEGAHRAFKRWLSTSGAGSEAWAFGCS
jgi:hypothetical protein